MRKIFLGGTILLTACGGNQEHSRTEELSYALTPIFSEEENQLNVEVKFTGEIDGTTTIRVGSRWNRDDKAGKRFKHLSVSGQDAELPADLNQPLLQVRHAPGAELTISYQLSSKDMDDAATSIEYFYVPVLLPDVIHLIGSSSLIVPRWDAPDASFDVEINWTDLPKGWVHIDTLPARAVYPREIASQILATAPSENVSVTGEPYELTILTAGEHDFKKDVFRNEMARVYASLNTLWKANEPRFLVTLLGTPDYASYSAFTGTGRFNSFASAASKGIALNFLTQFLSHEVAHHWVPSQLGNWPDWKKGENYPPKITWFSEGFTDFVMTRAMLLDGHWTQDDLLDYTNQYLRDYYLSPAKTAKAHTIDDLFWSDYEHEKQPYWRGFLLAMNWNSEINEKTASQSGAMDVLQAMYETAKMAPQDDRPILTSEYIAQSFSAKAGRDLFEDVKNFYYEGELINPNPDMFRGFAALKSKPVYIYDVGFDVETTLSSGTVTGVVRDHNVAKAGLKDGQTFVSKVSGGGGDTTTPLVFEVDEDGKRLTISYFPISGDPIAIPQFEKIGDTPGK